jgi:hypothetical protein
LSLLAWVAAPGANLRAQPHADAFDEFDGDCDDRNTKSLLDGNVIFSGRAGRAYFSEWKLFQICVNMMDSHSRPTRFSTPQHQKRTAANRQSKSR